MALTLCLSVFTAVALGGCWDRTEVNDLAFVSGVAFDAAPNGGFQVTLAVLLPNGIPSPVGGGGGGGVGGQPTTTVISGTGPSVTEAVASTLQQEVPARIFWGHTRVVIIGGALAERGIAPVIDFLMRDRTTRLVTEVVVTQGEAGQILLTSPPVRAISTDNIVEGLRLRLMPKAPIYRIAADSLRYGLGVAVPEIEVVQPTPPGGQGGGASGGGQGSHKATSPPTFDIGGVGMFQDAHLSGWMSSPAARGAMWLLGQIQRGTVSFTTPQGVRVTAELESAKIRRRAILQDGRPAIRIQIRARDSLVEVSGGKLRLDQPNTITELNDLLDASIRDRAQLALTEAQAAKVDVFEFGRLVAADQPRVWRKVYRDWPDTFARIPVILEVNAQIERTGNLINPPVRGSGH